MDSSKFKPVPAAAMNLLSSSSSGARRQSSPAATTAVGSTISADSDVVNKYDCPSAISAGGGVDLMKALLASKMDKVSMKQNTYMNNNHSRGRDDDELIVLEDYVGSIAAAGRGLMQPSNKLPVDFAVNSRRDSVDSCASTTSAPPQMPFRVRHHCHQRQHNHQQHRFHHNQQHVPLSPSHQPSTPESPSGLSTSAAGTCGIDSSLWLMSTTANNSSDMLWAAGSSYSAAFNDQLQQLIVCRCDDCLLGLNDGDYLLPSCPSTPTTPLSPSAGSISQVDFVRRATIVSSSSSMNGHYCGCIDVDGNILSSSSSAVSHPRMLQQQQQQHQCCDAGSDGSSSAPRTNNNTAGDDAGPDSEKAADADDASCDHSDDGSSSSSKLRGAISLITNNGGVIISRSSTSPSSSAGSTTTTTTTMTSSAVDGVVSSRGVVRRMREKPTLARICSQVSCASTSKLSSGWRTARKIVYLTPFFQTYKKNRYPWVQLAGHQGNFKSGEEQGTILKKLCGEEERCLRLLSQEDALRPFVPEYKGRLVGDDGQVYLVLQDLLAEFSNPCVMDCKMGLRTYLEEELAKAREKPKLRKDMYEKMCQIDPDAPSKEEHDVKAVTKPRYMVWRETISSTATLGFRIDGIKKADGELSKDFKTTRSRPQVREAIESFVRGFPAALRDHQQKLRDIKTALTGSRFFAGHEVIGSSLLFVHDSNKSGIWLIDFAKTFPIPPGTKTTHCDPWVVGNHEDGYLIGLNNLVDIFTEMCDDVDHATSSSSIVVDAARDNS